jgi:tripartite ATP-independent transporter DctM subunit
MFTRMAVPEMLRRGYPHKLAVGVVAGSAMLGMLIPPSVLMIIYAVITETSIGDMYTAGIVPGIILSVAFMATIWVVAGKHPGMAAAAEAVRGESGDLTHGGLLRLILPIVLLVVLVLGGMYAGLFTATEAGAVGAAGATLIALARRALTPRSFWQILIDTGYVTASIVLIIASAALFTRFLAISGLPSYLSQWIATHQFSLLSVMLVYIAIVLVLGTALDSVSTILIAVPVFAPVFKDLGADLVWVGIITMITVEVGIITPPLGISPFIVKSTLDADGMGHKIPLSDIYRGALPFAAAALVVVGLIVAWPPLALWFK